MFFRLRTVYLSAVLLGTAVASPDVSAALQKILDQAHQGPLYDYPTSFTQGILPVSGFFFWLFVLRELGSWRWGEGVSQEGVIVRVEGLERG
jgi:hypothetical protein